MKKLTLKDLTLGTQIAYIPDHAKGNIKHKDVEYGFVTSVREKENKEIVAFCRYWNKFNSNRLRTVANSEATPADNLVLYDSKNRNIVDELIKQMRYKE